MKYQPEGLDIGDVPADPVDAFRQWYAEVDGADPDDPNAVVLATAGADGRPSARNVLLKGVDAGGFTFFTSYQSRKGVELAANPHACLLFAWQRFGRQISVTGPVEQVTGDESDAYFATRPRGSQLGAWASHQSAVLANRDQLDDCYEALEEEYVGRQVPRPPYWGGFRLAHEVVELWQGRPNRLHDRLRYRRNAGAWVIERLSP